MGGSPYYHTGGAGAALILRQRLRGALLAAAVSFFFRSLASMVKGGLGTVVMVPEDGLDRGTVGASEDAGLSDGSIVFGFYSFGSLVC